MKQKKVGKIFKILAKRMPELKDTLIRAQMRDPPEYFLKKVITISFGGSFAFCFLFLLPLVNSFGGSFLVPIIFFPLMFIMLYFYMLKIPNFHIMQIEKDITKELLFALRFLIIELESGILIYKAFANIRRTYPYIGRYFGEVVDLVEYGTDVEEALNTVVNKCPSDKLRMVFVQIQNTIKTGSDIVTALNSTVDQFTREERIMVDEYSKKLNPIAMFYMIVAVIFPSIGFMMMIIISSFIGLNIDLPILFGVVVAMGFMQFMFVSMIKSMRPPVEF